MKSCTNLPRKRTNRAITAFIVCMTVCVPTLSLAAATATVNFGFSGGGTVVVPVQAGTTVGTAPPIFTAIQASTELGTAQNASSSNTAVAQPTETAPGVAPQQAAKSSPRIGVGIDTLSSDRLKIYTIPLSYTINNNFSFFIQIRRFSLVLLCHITVSAPNPTPPRSPCQGRAFKVPP